MKKYALVAALVIVTTVVNGQLQQTSAIKQAIEKQFEFYPASTLKDICKNFFQDYYGPGHLLSDTAKALKYLNYELDMITDRKIDTIKVYPLGFKHQFYRINLSFIRDGIIPKAAYFNAFVKSAQKFQEPDIEEWKQLFRQIVDAINEMGLTLPDFDDELQEVNQQLEQGEPVVHHSKLFIDTYHPHYRIIHKDEWEKLKAQYNINY